MSEFWQGKNVLVTGATGLIGSWLVKSLVERRAAVTALVRDVDPCSEFYRSGVANDVRVVNGSLEAFRTLERSLNECDIDTVFHLGAQAIVPVANRSPLSTFESNIRGTYNLLEACRIHQDRVQRIVIASSDKAYGEQGQTCSEELGLEAKHPYEVSKACGELLARSYAATYGLPIAIARCGNIYGGGDLNWNRIVPGTIRSLLGNERPVIRSDGHYVRDYVYVKDVTEAYVLLAEELHRADVQGEAFNFSMERPLEVLELVALLRKLTGAEALAPDVQNTAQGEIVSQSLSAKKAREVLGWRPQWELEPSLLETIEWYRAFFAAVELVR